MLPISICMIMKNEEKQLRKCLDSIKDFGMELVLVDTGSTDSTVEIAGQYTDSVHYFDWIDDFSAARNYALSLASQDWVLILDCDEYVTLLNPDSLTAFMKQHPTDIGLLSRRNHYELNGTDSVYVDKVERFFNRKLFHYEGKIHEQVCPIPSLDADYIKTLPAQALYGKSDITLTVEHTGYNASLEELAEKAARNNKLLLEMLQEEPDNPYLYFQIGQSYNLLHDDEKAAFYYGKGLEYNVDPSAEYVQMMVIGYGYALLHLERFEEALFLQHSYDDFATTADFVCMMGVIYMRTGNYLKAMMEFLKATTFPSASVEGANSFIPYYNMGCINELLGDTKAALTFYKKCGDFAPAAERLRELQP